MNTSFPISTKTQKTEKNGMTVFSVHTSDDVTTVVGSFPAGKMYDTERAGVAAFLTARMLDQGTVTHSKEELHDLLEGMGASVGFDIDGARGRFVVACMTRDLPVILEIAGDMLREPRFDPTDLGTMKKRVIAEIIAESDDPRSVAMSAFLRTVFPIGHPYHTPTSVDLIALVENVSVEDLRQMHDSCYGRGDLAIVGVGKTDHAVFADMCMRVFGALPLMSGETVLIPAPLPPSSRAVIHEEMPGKTSSVVFVGGALPFAADRAEYDAFMVGMQVLGGGMFANRLNKEVREKRGLTYHTRSYIAGYQGMIPGYWYAMAMFPPRSFKEGTTLVLAEIEGIITGGITSRELAEKKEELVGRFVTMFDDRQVLASLVLGSYEQHIPIEHWDAYSARVNGMTGARVNDALRTYLHPKRLVVASAGEMQKEHIEKKKK